MISIPVNGLYRGEAGSRNNDIKSNIDPRSIIRFDIGFRAQGDVKAIYLDDVRFVKQAPPAGILAFDFGPESQTLAPGFTPVSWNTVYGRNGCKAGLARAANSSSRARDDTFPTRLYQDFVEMGSDDNSFVAAVPNGAYRVWIVFDDCGYWGGETCRHQRRSITANGKEVWVDDRGEAGPADYLFRFEGIEPKPGDSIWDLYMKDLFKPVRVETEVIDGTLRLGFKADAPWSTKVAAIIIYPAAQAGEAEKWVAQVEAQNRAEFEARAVFMGPQSKNLIVPPDARGVWLGFPSLEEDIAFTDAPGKPSAELRRIAARGQRASFTFAVRPLKDGGAASLACTDLTGPGGVIPASKVDLRYVHHAIKRGFNDIAYRIGPEGLRRVAGSGLALTKDLTRQFWVTVAVPADAKAGLYRGNVRLTASGVDLSVPLQVDVPEIVLEEPDFAFGFYGTHVPGELPAVRRGAAMGELLTLLRNNGMNSYSGGPNIPFSGFDEAGNPKLDFAACDEFFRTAKACGFTGPVYHYGGPGMVSGLHGGYVIGEEGRAWVQKTGKPFPELLKIVWGAVKEHADRQGWPVIYYGLLDEPRVLERAQEHLEFHKAYRDAVPFVRAGGSYSVNWTATDPLHVTIQDLFKTMNWSALNSWDQTDLDKAREFGRELHIYNQGTSRYSFGAYQWACLRKGIRGRMQWHLLALHGYQFFDLDGREPDSAMINWGRTEIIPTISLSRCAEGAADFRFATTLWSRAQAKKELPAGKAALAWLDEVCAKIGSSRQPPKDFIDDESFRAACVEHLRKL